MVNTALRAEKNDSCTITFKNKETKNFIWNIYQSADTRMYTIRHWYIVLGLTETHGRMPIEFMILKQVM